MASAKTITVYRDLPWYYAEMLDWTLENGILKAYPKKPLSDAAHKQILRVFRRWGGKYVRWNGRDWYELVVEPRKGVSTEAAASVKKAYLELKKEA